MAHGSVHNASPLEYLLFKGLTLPARLLRRARRREPRPPHGALLLGSVVGRGAPLPPGATLWLSPAARSKHVLAIGGSGAGKSRFLESLICQDIAAGHGLVVIDPHADVVNNVLHFVGTLVQDGHTELLDKVILIEPHGDRVVGFNPLHLQPGLPAYLQVLELTEIFKAIFEDNWGVRIEEVLRNSLMLAAEAGLTLVEAPRLLTDPDLRQRLYPRLTAVDTRHFWQRRFDALSPQNQRQYAEPVLNRLGRFVGDPTIRAMLAQQRGLSWRQAMDGGFIVLVNLCKGIIKDVNLLGSLILGELYMAAMSRVDTPPERRRRVTVYVDELPNFVQDSSFVENALSEARKYGLAIFCCAQHLHQLDGDLVASLLANATTHVVFRTNAADGLIMATELSPMGRTRYLEKLLALEPRLAYALIRGEMPPVLMRTLEVDTRLDPARVEAARQASAQRFARSRGEVEREIAERERQLDRLVASGTVVLHSAEDAAMDSNERRMTHDGEGDPLALPLTRALVRSDGERGEFKPKREAPEAS